MELDINKKHSKCPLCGCSPIMNELEVVNNVFDGGEPFFLPSCWDCGLAVTCSSKSKGGSETEEDGWNKWEELVATFPKIMRLEIGDKVRIYYKPEKQWRVSSVSASDGYFYLMGLVDCENFPIPVKECEIIQWPERIRENY